MSHCHIHKIMYVPKITKAAIQAAAMIASAQSFIMLALVFSS